MIACLVELLRYASAQQIVAGLAEIKPNKSGEDQKNIITVIKTLRW